MRPVTKADKHLLRLIVAKAISDSALDEARDHVPPRDWFDVDITVRIRGRMKVGEPFEQTRPSELPWRLIAVLALDRLNESSRQRVLSEAIEAVEDHAVKEATAEALDLVRPSVADELDILTELTRRTMRGQVRTEFVVERGAA